MQTQNKYWTDNSDTLGCYELFDDIKTASTKKDTAAVLRIARRFSQFLQEESAELKLLIPSQPDLAMRSHYEFLLESYARVDNAALQGAITTLELGGDATDTVHELISRLLSRID